nr:reverse transcriptase domain-containing protein [Tanacetum cinerariifolium]
MSTRSSARNYFSPLDNPELTIRRRPRVDPTLLNDFEMATNENGDDVPPPGGCDLPVPDLRTMKELCQPTLNGRGDNANKHLDKFLHVTQSIKVNGVTDDALRLYLFPHSLTHHATAWFDRLPRNSITTFEQMAKMCLEKYFPPSMVTKLRNEITNFRGTFMKRRPEECYDLIKNMTAHRHDWDTLPPLAKLRTYMLREPIIMVMNTASSLGSGTLPSNTIIDPKEDLKGITTRSRNAYKGPTIPAEVVERETKVTKDTVPPTNNESTKDVQPSTVRALIDVYEGELTLRVGNKAITFNLDQTSRYSDNYDAMSVNRIDLIDVACEEYSQKILGFFGYILLLEGFLNDDPSSPPFPPQELKVVEPANEKYSIDEPPVVKLKDLPPQLKYAFLEGDDKLPVIIAKDLKDEEKTALIKVLKSHKQPLAWQLFDIKDPQDQEKTTFTCPYLTFAYRHMPFGLYNAPGTFQRCMMAIFHDMIKKMMEVFMDDFSVFGNSFRTYLSHLDKMLKRCEDTNICLNWEKSHFMVKEGIILGHKIFKNGIEVDKAKVDVIVKLPHPTTVKGIRSCCFSCGNQVDNQPCRYCTCERSGYFNRGVPCLGCNSKAENSFTYEPTPYSYNDSLNFSDYPPQPQYNTYFCELCGNDAHYGYDVHLKFRLSTDLNLTPSESKDLSEDLSDIKSECDVPVCDDFMTFSNLLFDSYDDSTSSDDKLFFDEDVSKENFKIFLNHLSDEEIIFTKIDPYHFNAESDLIESLLDRDTLIISYPKFDSLLEEFSEFNSKNSDVVIESFSPSHILVEGSDSLMEEIDIFLAPDDSIPSGIENDDYDSEGDIIFLEELLSNDFPSLLKNESFHFDVPSSPCPPVKPPNDGIYFEPDTGILTAKVVGDISKHYVLMSRLLPTQPTLCPVIDTLLPFSSKNEDKVHLLSHRGFKASQRIFDFFEISMMNYGGKIPILDVPFLHFYPP